MYIYIHIYIYTYYIYIIHIHNYKFSHMYTRPGDITAVRIVCSLFLYSKPPSFPPFPSHSIRGRTLPVLSELSNYRNTTSGKSSQRRFIICCNYQSNNILFFFVKKTYLKSMFEVSVSPTAVEAEEAAGHDANVKQCPTSKPNIT